MENIIQFSGKKYCILSKGNEMYLSVTIIIILTRIYDVHPTPERNKNAGGQVQIRHIY